MGHLLGRGHLRPDEPRDREDSPHRDAGQRLRVAREGAGIEIGRRARDGPGLAIRQPEDQVRFAARGNRADQGEGLAVERVARIDDGDDVNKVITLRGIPTSLVRRRGPTIRPPPGCW